MTTVRIDIPDDRATALQAKAKAQGLTLEDWISRKLDEPDADRKRRYTVGELMQQCDTAPVSDKERAWMQTPERGSIVERMRQLRARTKPDPEGWTVKDYINYGRP